MVKIFLHHLVCNIACTPNSITDCPEMLTPILFLEFRVFHLQYPRTSTFQPFDDITYGFRGSILNVHMHMVFTYDPFEYLHIFCITNLYQKFSTALLYIALQYFVAIFCYPYYYAPSGGIPYDYHVVVDIPFYQYTTFGTFVETKVLG